VTGVLALMLAVPLGHASPIFPLAGIAVAAMLIGGTATLLWTFLGSLLLNAWTGYSVNHEFDEARFAAAIIIAAASMGQAGLGGAALRRAVEIDPSGQPRRAAERAQYYPVTYVEPLDGNKQAVGFDLASNSDRNAAVEKAIDTEYRCCDSTHSPRPGKG
jgi:CHASE domain